jgi:8-amino-7-oxononanoate synthase
MGLNEFINKRLGDLKSINQYRELNIYSNDFLDFSSNDYLGLAKVSFDFTDLDSGSTGSRLITGNSLEFEDLEKEIAAWKKTEAALFFGSGYLANLGAISAMAGPRDVIFSDELNHSCILDGIRLSGAKKFFYKNLDAKHLQELLEKHRAGYDKAFVITDTVFSMQGTCADLKSIIDLKQDYDFTLYLDEAHATGTLGQTGAGLYASLVEKGDLEANQVEIQMGTFSKACGVEGAYVAGSKLLIDYLINFARTFIYSTAPSPYVVAMVQQNLKRLINAKDKRQALEKNIQYFRSKLDEIKISYTNDQSPIFAINLSTNEEALVLSEKFLAEKILLKAIRPPTVTQPCLRICLHSSHSIDDLDKVLKLLA